MPNQDLISQAEALNAVHQKRILVVEDNQINAIVLKRILQNYHFEVVIAEDGLKGVEATKVNAPDLILMDINMPVMNGLESASTIRTLAGDLKNIPIFAVTADLSANTQKAVLDVGMNEYISKPVEVDVLMNLVLQYLN